MTAECRQLSLVKGHHRFVFRYRPGAEAEVIGAFAELAGDEQAEFDWFDAAVLSYQLGRRLELAIDEGQADAAHATGAGRAEWAGGLAGGGWAPTRNRPSCTSIWKQHAEAPT